jgi:acetyl esterase/lipase
MLKLDPEIAATFAEFARSGASVEPPPPGDVLALRAHTDVMLGNIFNTLPDAPDVITADYETKGEDGAAVPMIWHEKKGAAKGPAVVYVHGGGMVAGTASIYRRLTSYYTQLSGVPFLSVDFRSAPEHSKHGLGKDVVAAIEWLIAHADELGVDPARIAIMGDSGGGGVGAAAAIIARDKGIKLAFQILIYPMLDDRNTRSDPFLAPTAMWSYEANHTAWTAVLGGEPGGPGVSPWLAPARLEDFTGLAPAYIEVGELDIFRDESIVYAQKLHAAGISCELHVHPGAPHGHDWANIESGISRRSVADRARILASL